MLGVHAGHADELGLVPLKGKSSAPSLQYRRGPGVTGHADEGNFASSFNVEHIDLHFRHDPYWTSRKEKQDGKHAVDALKLS